MFCFWFCWICILSKICCDFGFLKKLGLDGNGKLKVSTFASGAYPSTWHQLATWQHAKNVILMMMMMMPVLPGHWSGSPTDMYLDVTSRSKWVGEPDYFSHSSFQLFWFIKSSEAALEEAFKSGSHDFYIFSLSFQQKSKRCLRQNQFTCKCISELKRQWQRCIKVINGQVLVCTRRLGLVGEPRVDILHTNCILHQREKKGMTLRSF